MGKAPKDFDLESQVVPFLDQAIPLLQAGKMAGYFYTRGSTPWTLENAMIFYSGLCSVCQNLNITVLPYLVFVS